MSGSNPTTGSDPEHGRVRHVLKRLEVNRAVAYAVALRIWQVGAGAVSFMLIALNFSSQVQGYYLTFWSVVALQVLLELGISIVVTNISSHEWARLSLNDRGDIQGDPSALSRLVSLGRLIFRWYGVACFLFIAGVGSGGTYFFSLDNNAGVEWFGAWILVVLFSGLSLWVLPFIALLEGCGQITTVVRFRLIQAAVTSLFVWTSMLTGLGIRTAAVAAAVRLVCELILVALVYRRFFAAFFHRPVECMDWRTEIWPMQWRLALGGIFSYFAYNLFNLVMFQCHGSAEAGRMGMTRLLLLAVQTASLAWVQMRVPQFGVLIANREFATLDRRFKRLTVISLSMISLGGCLLIAFVWSLGLASDVPLGEELSGRLLPLTPTVVFVVGIVLHQLPQCQIFYLRAHKQEPMLVLSVIGNACIGLLVWLLGWKWGATGAACGYTVVVAVVILPFQHLIWKECRGRWHAPASAPNDPTS